MGHNNTVIKKRFLTKEKKKNDSVYINSVYIDTLEGKGNVDSELMQFD